VLPYDEIKVMAGRDGRSTVVQLPEVAVMLAVRTTVAGRSDVIVVGPRTRGSYHPSKAVPQCIRIRLRPGRARAVLGVPVSEVADRAVPLTDLWGPAGRRLTERLAAAGDDVDLALAHLADAVGGAASVGFAGSGVSGGLAGSRASGGFAGPIASAGFAGSGASARVADSGFSEGFAGSSTSGGLGGSGASAGFAPPGASAGFAGSGGWRLIRW
jgi:hypothetical protein